MKEISSLFKYHWGLIPILSLILVQVGIGPVEGFPAVADGQTGECKSALIEIGSVKNNL